MKRRTRVAAYAYPTFDEQSGRRHGAPIALPVTLFQRGGVLVPVGELRVILFQHQRQPAGEHQIDIPAVAAVLQH